MDEVLFRLAEASLREECPDDAVAYLQKLLLAYPMSSYVQCAFEKLNEIAVASQEKAETPAPR